jgi:hypothetical protein
MGEDDEGMKLLKRVLSWYQSGFSGTGQGREEDEGTKQVKG